MVTFKEEIDKRRRRRDGSIPIVIRVTQNRKIRRIQTNLVAYADDLSRDFKIRNRSLRSKLDDLIKDLYSAVDSIPIMDLPEYSVDQIVAFLRAKSQSIKFRLDYFAFAHTFVKTIKNPATKKTFLVALSAMRRYLDSLHMESIDINDITANLLAGFVDYCNSEHKKYFRKRNKQVETTTKPKKEGTAAKAYMSKLSQIFAEAKKRYNDEDAGEIRIPRSPFSRVKIKASPSEGQKPLSLATIRTIVNATVENEYERAALDTFILSFGLMGANLVDLYKAAPPATEWQYRRTKTEHRREDHAEMHVRVPDCLRPFLQRLMRHARKDRWLNISWRYSSVNSATKTINDLLKRWAKRNGLAPFTLYAARKSWATIARSKACGIDKAIVDECLAHVGDFRLTDIYAQRDWEVIWAANDKVCNLVFWE